MAKQELGDIDSLPTEEAEAKVREFAVGVIVYRIRASVARLNVRYDEWFPESRLWQEGRPPLAIERLRESAFFKERTGALGFRPALQEGDGLGERVRPENAERVWVPPTAAPP